jgi:hypothetical protein
MLRVEELSVEDKRWDEVVKKSVGFDFYHTAGYHKLDNLYVSKLYCCFEGDNFIALPIVVREIKDVGYRDITSVYGYAGPIFSMDYHEISENLKSFFISSFKTFCEKEKIVSFFMRLNPLIEQMDLMAQIGEVSNINKTVSIDLTLPLELQKKDYRKSLKSELNQLRRKGFHVIEAASENEIDEFIAIYYETMDRVNAKPNYYFPRDYFYNFLKNESFQSKLLLCRWEDKNVAGAIFTIANNVMQYHLAGTKEDFIKYTPMKLILDEARIIGTNLGLKDLHLGGGVGGKDDDSLFRFKSGFSKKFCQFSVCKSIVSLEMYNRLVEEKANLDLNSSYFPLYRL